MKRLRGREASEKEMLNDVRRRAWGVAERVSAYAAKQRGTGLSPICQKSARSTSGFAGIEQSEIGGGECTKDTELGLSLHERGDIYLRSAARKTEEGRGRIFIRARENKIKGAVQVSRKKRRERESR